MRTKPVTTTHEASPFTLDKATEVKNHFQYLVGNKYIPGSTGHIEAIVICPHSHKEELIHEYHNKKTGNPQTVFKPGAEGKGAYDVMIMARVSHPHLTSLLDVFKDIRTYAAERHIHYRF